MLWAYGASVADGLSDRRYTALRQTGRKLYADGPKMREFPQCPVSGTAP
jgi:hypothetical protein